MKSEKPRSAILSAPAFSGTAGVLNGEEKQLRAKFPAKSPGAALPWANHGCPCPGAPANPRRGRSRTPRSGSPANSPARRQERLSLILTFRIWASLKGNQESRLVYSPRTAEENPTPSVQKALPFYYIACNKEKINLLFQERSLICYLISFH